MSRTRERLALVAVLLLGPLLVAWPLPLVWRTHILSHHSGEAASHIWGLWLALVERSPLVIESARVSYPDGYKLVLIDPGNLPWFALGASLGPAAAYNAVLYGGILLAGLGGAMLARRVDGSVFTGAIAGMLCLPLLAASSEGTTEDFGVGWVAIQLALLLRFSSGGPWWTGVLSAGALAMAWYCGPYNGIWAVSIDAAVGVALLARARQGLGPALRALAVGAGSFVLVAPLIWATETQRSPGLPGTEARVELMERLPPGGDFRGGLGLGADLVDPFLPSFLTGGQATVSHSAYLGFGTLVIAAVLVWRRRQLWPWLVGALAFALLSMGPYMFVMGQGIGPDSSPTLAPAGWLMEGLSPLRRLTRWYRAGAVAALLLVPVISVAGRGRWALPVVVWLIIEVTVLAPMQWPLNAAAVPDGAAYAALDGPGALVEQPAQLLDATKEGGWLDEHLLRQTLHGRAITGSAIGVPNGTDATRAYRAMGDLMRTGRLAARSGRWLRGQGFRWFALYPQRLPGDLDAMRTRIEACLGAPIVDQADLIIYRLDPPARGCVPTGH